SGQRREIAPKWDRSADAMELSEDGRTLYVNAQHLGEHPLFAVDIATGMVSPIVREGSVSDFDLEAGTLAFARSTLRSGDQIFVGGIG
ncbi:hypothetical protein KXS51_24715, partial [Salmonella enterica subsp. enterica serovar Weltevreden]|nr:hypothetical protein [Salmonella enterica subsp. enterica serovar Weltevreden]